MNKLKHPKQVLFPSTTFIFDIKKRPKKNFYNQYGLKIYSSHVLHKQEYNQLIQKGYLAK